MAISAGVLAFVTTGSQTLHGDDWARATLKEAGFETTVGERIDQGVRQGSLSNLHGVVIVRGGKLVFEHYFEGPDERRGRRLGVVEFTPATLHDLRSVSKSVVGLLYGIALAEGKVPPPDAPLLAQFSKYPELADDPARRNISVADALSMQLGLEWDESLPYTDPRNSETAMDRTQDRCRFVLSRPVRHEPGTQWTYTGGATALLACLIVDGTGMSLLEYARARLFTPLGIEHVEWVTHFDGAEIAASGLRLRPRDMARIGQLVLDRGAYAGVQVVPAPWIDESLESHANVDDQLDYGYHWWIAPHWGWVAAFGNGGQRITVLPRLNLVVAVTAGNYNQPDAWKVPVGVLVDAVLPSIRQ